MTHGNRTTRRSDQPPRRDAVGKSLSSFLVLIASCIVLTTFALFPVQAQAGIDDYPVSLKNAPQDSLVDPWKFYNRECTSFVAWRLNSRNGVAFNDFYGGPEWGNANHWDDAARALGISVNGTPAVGAIAQTDAGEAGHVAWVEAVNSNGTVTLEEYNHDGTGQYSERTAATSSFVYIHLKDLPTGPPAEGSFVTVAGNGEVYRIVGGAPLYVSSWAPFGGPQPTTTVTADEINAMRSVPRDGTFITSLQDGRVYRIAGGAPLYVSSWSAVGGPQSTIPVDEWDVYHPDDPHAHLRQYPADGTFINTGQDGRVYRIAGGAPLYVSSWSAVGGNQPYVTVDEWDVDNTSDGHAHLRQYPADGTFISTGQDGRVYRIAGGAPLYVSSWSIFGGVQPYVTADRWDVENASSPTAHLRAVPADGTLVEGLPSGGYWVFHSGLRKNVPPTPEAIGVDDVALANYGLEAAPQAVGSAGVPQAGGSRFPNQPASPAPTQAVLGQAVHATVKKVPTPLARALARCKKAKNRHKRARCIARARRRYHSSKRRT